MTAIDRLDAWLRISPSTVLPAEVLEYLDDVKAENAKLRELCVDYDKTLDIAIKGYVGIDKPLLIGASQTALRSRMRNLDIEVSS